MGGKRWKGSLWLWLGCFHLEGGVPSLVYLGSLIIPKLQMSGQ